MQIIHSYSSETVNLLLLLFILVFRASLTLEVGNGLHATYFIFFISFLLYSQGEKNICIGIPKNGHGVDMFWDDLDTIFFWKTVCLCHKFYGRCSSRTSTWNFMETYALWNELILIKFRYVSMRFFCTIFAKFKLQHPFGRISSS